MLEVSEGVPLAPMTTIGIGGPARYFAPVRSVDDVAAAVEWSRRQRVPLFVLGGGSNLLIADEGFPGLVARIEMSGITVESVDDFAMVKAAAGEPWDSFVARVVEKEWAGVECLSGIPGLIGGTPIQNVGAYGQEVAETIARVEAFDRETSRIEWFTNAECEFSYRQSRFKGRDRGRFVVLSVTYRLRCSGAPTVRYPDLQRYLLDQQISHPALRDVRAAVIAVRKRKGMVVDPKDPDSRSDGSFFMNPVLSDDEMATFRRRVEGDFPTFPAEGGTKLSAAWLIEQAGFTRGTRRGNVGLSTKHTLAIVNRGGATAAEVIELVGEIQASVREEFGVGIQPEPVFVGFEEGDPSLRSG